MLLLKVLLDKLLIAARVGVVLVPGVERALLILMLKALRLVTACASTDAIEREVIAIHGVAVALGADDRILKLMLQVEDRITTSGHRCLCTLTRGRRHHRRSHRCHCARRRVTNWRRLLDLPGRGRRHHHRWLLLLRLRRLHSRLRHEVATLGSLLLVHLKLLLLPFTKRLLLLHCFFC